MRPRRALFAWEIGGGRGHISHLIVAAKALKTLGFDCTSARVLFLENAHELDPYVGKVVSIPSFNLRAPSRGRHRFDKTMSHADWLGDHGLCAAEIVLDRILQWIEIFKQERTDLLVCDLSPYALLAARAVGIPCAAIGVGYLLPPPNLESLPVYNPDEKPVASREAQITDAVNCALAGVGGPRLEHLSDVFACDVPLVCTNSLFDPYAGRRRHPLCPPVVPPVGVQRTRGEEVFFYLSSLERYEPAFLAAVTTLPLPRRVFMPALDPFIAHVMRERGVIVEDAPVPPMEIARRSRLTVHAANHGISTLSLRAGLPFVCVPIQTEQLSNGQRAEGRGAATLLLPHGNTVPAIQNAILNMYESETHRERALEVSEEFASEFTQAPEEAIAERVTAIFH